MSKPQSNQRIRFYDGQLLTSKDLWDERAYADWLRGLHLRVLHDTWGIALGLNIIAAARELLITPGLAYNCRGQEILLAETLQLSIPVPLPPTGLILAIRHNKTLEDNAAITATCDLSNGLDLNLERPTFLWQKPDQLCLGEEIPLARVYVKDNSIELDLSIRRNIQSLQRPNIGWGLYEIIIPIQSDAFYSSQYNWVGPNNPHPIEGFIGLQFNVNTSEAGFMQTPFYFATFQASVLIAGKRTSVLPYQLYYGINFQSIADPTPNEFTLQVLVTDAVVPASRVNVSVPAGEKTLSVQIFWTGIEPLVRCDPSLNQECAFTEGGSRLHDWQTKWLPQLTTNLARSASFSRGEP
ncbi:MAG: hypothetical protein MUF72_15700 [Elainella sp. Prado103]|jgi:hypothetical protein|nr:hypothetical protein [Elainella sp. Prado103]